MNNVPTKPIFKRPFYTRTNHITHILLQNQPPSNLNERPFLEDA